MFHCLKVRQATESDLNHLTCIVKRLAVKSVSVEALCSKPITAEVNYEQPDEPINAYVQQVAPVDSDFLFQPY